MKKQRAIEILKRQITPIGDLQGNKCGSDDFTKWWQDTKTAVRNIFVEPSENPQTFEGVRYSLMMFTTGTPDSAFQEAYVEGLSTARSILESFVSEVEDYWSDDEETPSTHDYSSSDTVKLLCNRFHQVARQLQNRHDGRPTLDVADEYDVQDLFHGLLRIFFDDVRDEEWTPSYAGSASRVDFLLKQERTILEIKKTRKGLGVKQVGEQLIIDIQKYQVHPDCKTLVCFVYDPEERISNPRGIENDLNQISERMKVVVFIRPN